MDKKCCACKVKTRAYKTAGYCRDCLRLIQKKHNQKRLEDFRELMDLAKDNPCKDCGVKYPTFVMEFDHLPEFEKKFNVSCGAFQKPEALRDEMLKCELVCANCHKFRTHKRRNGKNYNPPRAK